MFMDEILHTVNSALFEGICYEDRRAMLGCIGYHIGTFRKGDIINFEDEKIKHVGITSIGIIRLKYHFILYFFVSSSIWL